LNIFKNFIKIPIFLALFDPKTRPNPKIYLGPISLGKPNAFRQHFGQKWAFFRSKKKLQFFMNFIKICKFNIKKHPF
jgi:hypothetical protein